MYCTASRRHNVNSELTLYTRSFVKFHFDAKKPVHSLYLVLFSRTCSQKMVRGYIFAGRIRKHCHDSLERRFTRRVSETIFGKTRLCKKTRTSRILPVSVPLRSCDSYVFMIMKCLMPKLVVLKPDGFEKGGFRPPKPPLAAPLVPPDLLSGFFFDILRGV